jgi:hypothetical protein
MGYLLIIPENKIKNKINVKKDNFLHFKILGYLRGKKA